MREREPSPGDYHLKSSSPAIDYSTDLGITTDLEGRLRPIGAKPDLGAYETLIGVYLPLLRRN